MPAEISPREAVSPAVIAAYGRRATGGGNISSFPTAAVFNFNHRKPVKLPDTASWVRDQFPAHPKMPRPLTVTPSQMDSQIFTP